MSIFRVSLDFFDIFGVKQIIYHIEALVKSFYMDKLDFVSQLMKI